MKYLAAKEINYELINDLYMAWRNERDPFMQRKRKEEVKSKVSQYELLMYSTRYSLPFEAFRNIYSLADLFETLEEMQRQGEDISILTNQPLVMRGIEDIQALNEFAKRGISPQIGEFRLKFQGSSIFEYGDVKGIGKTFPYACVNFLDLELVDKMLNKPKDYKGIPVIITIDNIGQLPLEKLESIEQFFDVAGVRIIEKDRTIQKHQGEQSPLTARNYKQIRTVIDDEIISKLYVDENADKMTMDYQLATQILDILSQKIEYDSNTRDKNPLPFSNEMVNASGLIGLLRGKSICTGYSEILRNVLSCVNVESAVIIGKTSNGEAHAWNKIKLGNAWTNVDFTFARKQILKGEASGDLFMSDMAFYEDRRMHTFEKGKEVNGKSVECTVAIGGHERPYGEDKRQCGSYVTPYLTQILIQKSRQYDEEYKKQGKTENYKGPIPYVGSNIQKTRSNFKNIEAFQH